VITTVHGHVVDVNTYALNLFEYTREEMVAMNFQQLYIDPDDGHRFRKEMKERGSAGDFYARLRRSDGSEMECTMNVVCRHGKNGDILGYQGIIRDVTEARRLQVRLQESRKTEAITTLAGGIAHQFNNALTPIMGNIDILQMEHAQDEDLMDTLKQMNESCRRMANLTSQLLAYARGGKYAVDSVKSFEGAIDLALLDIKLPDMSGSQVYPLIMEDRPGLKVVVASGYSIDGPAQEILHSEAQGFIQKPFSIEALASKIREAMES
jgi:PAS domain S-box-containing protein